MILITGATGFLGKYLVDEFLSSGYDVRVLVRNSENRKLPWGKLVEVVDGDILDIVSLEKAVEGVDAVIHAAAMVSFWRKQRPELMRVNVEGTKNVVNACLEANIPQLVHISSIASMGNTSNGEIINEETPWLPSHAKSGYALSKRKAEMEIHRGISEGLASAVMLNPALILGAGNWTQGTPKMFSVVDNGLSFYNPGATGIVAASDVAIAARLVMEKEVPNGERYILSGENMTYQELFTIMAKYLGKKPPSRMLPAWLTLNAGKVSEMLAKITKNEPIITLESMRSSMNARKFDGTKIQELGLEYKSIDKLLQETAEVFLKEKK